MQFDVAGAIKAGATPDQIAQFLAEKQGFDLDGALGAGASVDQVIGFLAKPAKEPESRHIGAVLNDTVISIANAAAGGVAAAGDAIAPGNRFSKFIDENIVKAGEASQSDAVKAGREKFQREVAASDGLGDEAAAVGRYLADSPLQAAGQAFGSFAGPGLAIKGARGVAGLLGLGARGTVAAGTAAGVATGAAMGGGDAGGEAYDLVMATPDDVLLQNDAVRAEVAKGRPLAEVKEEAAVSAARKASVLPAIAGGVSGAFGVERFLSGGKGFSGGLISRAVKSGLSEAVPEGLEEGLAAYTGQAAASAYDPSIDPMKGVGASATLGAALGLGPGMAAGVLDGVQSHRRAVAEQALQQATDAASAAAAANEMASVDLDAAVNEVEQAVSAYLRPDGGIPTPEQAMAQPTIETPQPLTPQEKQELARQQLQSTPVADPLAELRLQVNPATTMADVAQRRDAVETSAIERMLAADMARPAPQEVAPAPDLAQASAQETTENQLVGLEQKTRERMVNQLMEAAAEPSGYFASRMIPAIDQQLAVLKQPPLTPQERERVVGLTGAAQAFTQPTLPEAPAPAIPDRGADNTSLEARIPEKIPRPSRILGQPTSSYTDDQLTRMIDLPDIPAVSRRGASIELSARQAAQPKAAQQAATLTNEGTMPQAAPVLEQPQVQPARVLEQPQPQPAPVLEQPAMPAAPDVSVGFKPGTQFLQAQSPAGTVGGTVRDGVLRISFAEVNEDQRGKGEGVRLYSALIDKALADGLKVTSDSTVEADAVRVYESLGRRGYKVNRLEGGMTTDGAAYGKGATEPAFAIESSQQIQEQNPPLAQQTPAVLATETVAPTAPVQLGRDQTPLTEGGDLPASQPQDTMGALFSRERGRNPQEETPEFKRWFGDSRVVDADGKPLVVYHGTEADFSVFDPEKIGSANTQTKRGSGFYFAKDPALTSRYANREGANVIPAYVRITNPAPDIDSLSSDEYDGFINSRIVVVKSSTQVKSATGNNGDFDPANPDIRRSTPRGSKLATPSDGRIVNTDATTTGKAPIPGSKHTLQDGDTTHSFTVVDASRLGVQGRLIQQIARIFGKRVVAFQSDTLQADGFVLNDDQTSIYLNVESTISPMAVFGHELTHQMKKDNPQAYAALEAVVQRNVDEEGMAKFRQEYGDEANIEELSSDLVGNRFREPAFWEDVFNEVAAQNPTGAAAIVQRVGQSIRKAVDTLLKTIRQQGFNADAYVTNLEEIRDAVRVAMVDYAKQQREPAMAGVKDAPVVGDGRAKFSFAGRESKTADTRQLDEAQRQIAEGAEPDAVRQQTGWFKGNDGKWRYEIDDADATLLREPSDQDAYADIFDEAASRSNGVPLTKVLDHPALFAAYPKLQAVRVMVDDKMDGNGSYSAEENAIRVRDPYSYQGGHDELLSVLLHEIQHGIQKVEGFASGANPKNFSDDSVDAPMLRDGAILVVMMRSQGSIEDAKALFVRRFGREPASGAESAALSGESPESLRARAAKMLTPVEKYTRSAGEVEARNTQARQKMTDAERRATPPSQTADVADSDVIVMFNGKVAKNAPVPENAKFSNNRSAYDDIRRRLSDGRGIDDDSLLEFLAGQDRRKNARWGYVADRGGLPGVATIYWRGEVAGESGYYTAARFGRNGIGERAFMMGLFPASELTDGSLRDVSRAFADRGYVWYLSAVQTKDGSWEVGTDGAELGSKYRDALLARGEIAPAAGRYTRFTPKEVGLPNDLLREGVRRLSLLLNGRTPDVAFTRETGARPRDAITTIKGDRLESRFSRRRNIFGQQVLPTWTAPTETKLDDFLYVMQDKMVDTKRVVEAVKGAIGRIDDQWNPYLQEELYHGRTATKTKQFLGDELRPLLQDMQSRGVGMADFEEYLHNRHAEERNQQIAKVNPGMPDGGSGIDTADARAYLAGLDPAKRRAYEALARRIDAITAGTRQLLVDNGLETQDTIDAWDAAYSQYVPLNREDLDFSSSFTSTGTGQGFSVKGAASKRATGSKRKVVDILANIAMQRERAIVRAEKNRVATAVYGLATSQPNTDFWLAVNPDAIKDPIGLRNELVKMGLNPLDAQNLIEEPTQTYIDPRTGLVSQRINPALRSSPNVLAVRVDGKDRYVFFNASDERSQRMVTALKNLDADQLGRVMGMAAQVTRWFASVNTQYNPIFGAINFMRDVQGAALQLSTTPIADMKAQVVGDVIPALRGIYADIRAERKGSARPGGTWATLWEEFQKEGAQTGYRDQFSKSAERAQALESELKRITEGKAKQFGRAMFDWLSDYNETMENAVRLAAYKAGKDKGLTNQQAASVAKNLTVNFNRKGQIATQAGALYAFFNAAIQGSTRLVQTLTGPAGKTIIGGGLLLGVIQAVMLAAAGYDDDEPPEFARERGFIIPIDWLNNIGGPDLDGKYFTIPMPLGYNVIPNTSRVMTEFVLSGYRDPAKRVAQITGALLETFNPIGNAGWSVQTIAPTFADPLVALSENRDWTGKMIAKKDRSDTNPTPGYTRAKETASWFSKELSYYLNLASGGTKYKPGFLSPTPDQIDYLIGQVTGGVGREALKIEQTITSTVTGEELPPYKIPLAGRFYGDTKSSAAESNRFYENITRLNEHENEIKGRRENRENPGEYLRENPEARLYQFANKIEQDVTKLRKRRRELLERGASKESIKMIETQITNRMKRLNDRVKAVQDAED